MLTVSFLGYRVVSCSSDELCDHLIGRVEEGHRRLSVMCLNPHSIATAAGDLEFKRALLSADYLIPDGVGVVWASRLLGHRLPGRLTGSDLFHELMRRVARRDMGSSCFLGSTELVLERLKSSVKENYGRHLSLTTISPPFANVFDEETDRKLISAINAAAPDVLWIGMTAPKQEKWAFKNLSALDAGVVAGVGAVFDFVSGERSRAPKVLQVAGLEWLHRLVLEPRRMWKRTVLSGAIFFMLVSGAAYQSLKAKILRRSMT